MREWSLSLLLAFGAAGLSAKEAVPASADPVLEARMLRVAAELRCLVCQNQSIADSHADMAGDMRALVRERIAAGENPDDVRAWLITRYGDWVSFDPPKAGATLGLWLAPLLFLGVGLLLALRLFRRRGTESKS